MRTADAKFIYPPKAIMMWKGNITCFNFSKAKLGEWCASVDHYLIAVVVPLATKHCCIWEAIFLKQYKINYKNYSWSSVSQWCSLYCFINRRCVTWKADIQVSMVASVRFSSYLVSYSKHFSCHRKPVYERWPLSGYLCVSPVIYSFLSCFCPWFYCFPSLPVSSSEL